LTSWIDDSEENKNTVVAFANANCLNIAHRDSTVRAALGEAVVLNDGIGVDLASRLLFGVQFPHNLNGTDFTPIICSTVATVCVIRR
jgi:UDP-N-acetyl-D-mannosaminuronic acid transferase (WecB/TagA/CpsF family)